MQIIFNKVKWKNLLSYGDKEQVYFFEEGIDLISAKNGAGKSAVIDATFFALFGKPFRKIKNGSLINNSTNKKLLTEIYFSTGSAGSTGPGNTAGSRKYYKVQRGQKPNIFVIYENTGNTGNTGNADGEYKEIPEKATTKEYQKYFEEEILKIDETVFRQLISIASNMPNSKPFMDLTAKEKESLFQIITDTSIFNYITKNIKEKISSLKIHIKETEYKKRTLDSSIESEQIMIQQAKKQNDDFKKHHSNNITETENNITKTEADIVKYKEGIKKLKKLKETHDNEIIELTEFNQELNAIKIEIDNYNDSTNKKQEQAQAIYNNSIQELQDAYYSKKYPQEKEIEHLLDLKAKNETKIRELNIKIAEITSAQKGAITCKKCNEINYLTEIDAEEVKNKDKYKEEVKNATEEQIQLDNKITAVQESLEELKSSTRTKWEEDKLQAKITRDETIQKIKDENSMYRTSRQDEIQAIQNKINTKKALVDKIKEKLMHSKRIKETLQEQKDNLEFYKNKLIELKAVKPIIINEEPLNKKKEELKKVNKNLTESNKRMADLNYLINMLSEKSEYNLKGQVISRAIPFLNKGINYFLELFSMNEFSFVIDENFKEKLIYTSKGSKGSKVSDSEYNGLSNGQKMRISFSIMFSFLKLIEERNGVSCNILCLDEILDGSLDGTGREELLNMLKTEFSHNKNIIIISHNDQIKEKVEIFDRIVHINKGDKGEDTFSTLSIERI